MASTFGGWRSIQLSYGCISSSPSPTDYEGQRIRPSQTSPTSRPPSDYAPLSAVPPPFSENCLRGAYAKISRGLAASVGLLKLLFSRTFLQLLTNETPLTSAFGGQHSIQLSYGCLRMTQGRGRCEAAP